MKSVRLRDDRRIGGWWRVGGKSVPVANKGKSENKGKGWRTEVRRYESEERGDASRVASG